MPHGTTTASPASSQHNPFARFPWGITGWAQVNGSRGETPDAESVRRRVEHDVWYIDNWCLLIELKILVRTVRVLFGQSNAY